MRRAVRILVVVVTVGGILLLFVLPGRTWLAQGRAMRAAQHQHAVLSQENAALSAQAGKLQSTAYIEQLARQEFGLVMPGEKAYAVLPPPAAPTTTTTTTLPPQKR